MAKNTVKKSFMLTRDDGTTKAYAAGDTLEKGDADHWYAKVHCDDAAAEAADQEAAAAAQSQKDADAAKAADAQKQAEAATKAGGTARAQTNG